jgi:hypothetical protein
VISCNGTRGVESHQLGTRPHLYHHEAEVEADVEVETGIEAEAKVDGAVKVEI